VTVPDLPYRPCAGMLLLNAEGHIFVGKRIDQSVEAWQMPQGGIDDHEAPRDAALRELEEEIGTRNVKVLAEHPDWLTYDLPAHMIGVALKGQFRGQIQKWFALRFLGADSEINLKTAHEEFSEWKWVDAGTLLNIIVPFKRAIYEKVFAEFGPLIGR
jgi:putative (di)nucleoside polyphosphate hydrolase